MAMAMAMLGLEMFSMYTLVGVVISSAFLEQSFRN
jgi:hypothetical protein